jgi:protein required for attachment to host cells
MTKHLKTCYIVADGEHARVLLHDGRHFTQLRAFDSASAHQDSSDMGSERPGRSVESMGTGRHAIEPRSDPKSRAKTSFAHQIAQIANQAAAEGAFDQLVLVAPPHCLNDIKPALDAAVAAMLVGEDPKDLVKLPTTELHARLADIFLVQ